MSTRKRILEILQTRSAMTADELANILQLTPANLRHHLGKLERDGRVLAVGDRPPRGRGRPQRMFSLPQGGEGTDRLAGHLLDQMLSGLDPDQQAAAMRALAIRLRGEPDRAASPTRHITQRLGTAVRKMNDLEYQSRWEAHAIAPRVILGNCPYAAIIAEHPELCQMDSALLEALLSQPVKQTAKLERNQAGLAVCVFAVGRN